MTLEQAARAALETHDALLAAQKNEPTLGKDGLPIHPSAWLRWHDTAYKPAHQRWNEAMDTLAEAAGRDMSRHPLNFRPYCETILAGATS